MITIVFFDYYDNSRHGIEYIFIVVYKASVILYADVEVNSLVFGNILTLMLLGI